MEKVLLNKSLSKELAEKGRFVPKHCYDNVFDNLPIIGSEGFAKLNFKIMFAYVSICGAENLYTRHACYYLDGEAVDPTIVNVYRDNLESYDIKYIPIRIMTVNEYLYLLSREHRTDLFKTFRKVEEIKHKEIYEHGLVLLG